MVSRIEPDYFIPRYINPTQTIQYCFCHFHHLASQTTRTSSTSLYLADRRVVVTGMGITSCLRNRDVRQIVKDTELRGLRLEIGPLSASWVLEYRPQGLLEDGRRPSSKSYKFGDVHSHTPPEARVEASKLKNLIKMLKRLLMKKRKAKKDWLRLILMAL